jgi:predicted dehydrogenase
MTAAPCRVGLVGAGSTVGAYVSALRQADGFDVCAVATRTPETGATFSAAHGLAWMPFKALLADPHIDLVLNLTPPLAHVEVSHAALVAGKHVYSEKPLAATSAQAEALIALAAERGLLLASAPATLLHLYGAAAGPLYDMGVYPLTALLDLLGPVTAVHAFGSTASAERSIPVGPRAGAVFPVSAPTTVHASLRHASGALSTLVFSFDARGSRANGLELHGTRAAAHVPVSVNPDPLVRVSRAFGEWRSDPPIQPPSPTDFAAGVIEAWTAFQACRPVFASAARALETLLVLEAIAAAIERNAGPAATTMLTALKT